MNRNRIEEELNATRVKLYEITKDMTRSERVAYIKNHVAPTLKEYNIHTVSRIESSMFQE
jgi:hypothetical protein